MRLSNLLTAIHAETERARELAIDDTTDLGKRLDESNIRATSEILNRLVNWTREALLLDVHGNSLVTLYQARRLPAHAGGHVVANVLFGVGDPTPIALPRLGHFWSCGFELGVSGPGTSELALAILSHHLHVGASTRAEFEALMAMANPAARRAWRAHIKLAERLADGSANRAVLSNDDLTELLDSFIAGY